MKHTRRRCDSAFPQDAGRGLFSVESLLWLIREAEAWNEDLTREGDVDFLGVDDGLTLTVEFRSDLGTVTIVTLDHITGCFRMCVNGHELGSPVWN